MRIFQVLAGSSQKDLPDNRIWYINLCLSLKSLGHDVVFLPFEINDLLGNSSNSSNRSNFSQRIWDIFSEHHQKKPFDLFFSYLRDDMVEGQVFQEISKSGVPTCNFSCNNTHQFHLIKKISPYFDYSLHAERDVSEKFIEIGANPLWWPMAANPDYYRPLDVLRTIDASFVGGNYGIRANYIGHLLESNVDVHAFGRSWSRISKNPFRTYLKLQLIRLQKSTALTLERKTRYSVLLNDLRFRLSLIKKYPANLHLPVSDERMISLFSESKISLGFLEVRDRNLPEGEIKRHLHLREFEAPMSGACYCTGYLQELEEFYEPGREIITYRSKEELLDKVSYYLRHPGQAEKIRQAGRERALSEHTYQKRYQSLFKKVGLGE